MLLFLLKNLHGKREDNKYRNKLRNEMKIAVLTNNILFIIWIGKIWYSCSKNNQIVCIFIIQPRLAL